MMRMNTNRTTAVAIRASLWKPWAYPISMTILVVMVLAMLRMPSGMTALFPTITETASVSPIARPTPKITAAIMPDFAAGKTVKNTLLSWVAPRASAPS